MAIEFQIPGAHRALVMYCVRCKREGVNINKDAMSICCKWPVVVAPLIAVKKEVKRNE